MGCGSSKATNPQDPKFIIEASWEQAEKSVKKIGDRKTGWKTVRIFVSSTFSDFHQEREILVKKVWLQKWKHLIIINISK